MSDTSNFQTALAQQIDQAIFFITGNLEAPNWGAKIAAEVLDAPAMLTIKEVLHGIAGGVQFIGSTGHFDPDKARRFLNTYGLDPAVTEWVVT